MEEKKLLVVTGPSGAGLRDIAAAVIDGRDDVGQVTPVTARKMKPGEKDGVGYYFYDLDGWNAMKESGDLLEATELAGNDYGTSRRLVCEQLAAGKHVVLNLEPERAAQLKRNMPEALCVYMEPSSPALLRSRYEKRCRTGFEVDVRMEFAARLRAQSGFCDLRIPTDEPEEAVRALNALLDGE